MKTVAAILVIIGLLLVTPASGVAGSSTRYSFGFNFGLGPGYYGPYGWGPWPYWGPPYAYPAPMVVVPQQPQVYVQRNQPESGYWYYCQNPQGYYPYIKSCPGGWMKVVPDTVPPGR
ncbi:MAG: hypothetical protein HY895_20030 [Deltaproteobacteria bacterium]|nr:hypothetical protein [Deltaproteobacteria bacterium]